MSVPLLTAVSGAVWESDLVAALERTDHGVTVVRRCVDLADLLATATTGQARAVLLSADLRRLDRDALARLATAGVVAIGLFPPGDEDAERRLRQLGVASVLPADAAAAQIATAVLDALAEAAGVTEAFGDPLAALEALTDRPGHETADPLVPEAAEGRVVAVWGPTGAPGRTTVAVGLASEVAGLGRNALLIDADSYGGVVAQVLGLLDESPGLAAACRLANNGALDLPGLAAQSRQLSPTLRVLTGIARADRWPELRPAALEVVLELARRLAATTVVDCGFGLEQDEELTYDTMAPRRNGATLTALEQADLVLAVGSADPVGLQRLVRGLTELREVLPDVMPRVVVNRLRESAVPGGAEKQVRAALERFAGVTELIVVPYDVAGLDRALSEGRTLAEAAPGSPARQALTALAAELVGVSRAPTKRRLTRRKA